MSRWSPRLPRVSKTMAAYAQPTGGGRTDASASPTAVHDLEAHLSELRALDDLRLLSGKQRDRGGRKGDDKAPIALVELLKDEKDLPTRALGLRVLREVNRDGDAEIVAVVDDGLKDLAEQISRGALERDSCSVVLAARALRAFAASPKFALSAASMTCWYWIVRELYSVTGPEWAVGGARAGSKGWVTAYTTAQCVLAVHELAAALDCTAEYFRAVKAFEERRELFENASVPAKWRMVERKRWKRSRSITLGLLSGRASIDLEGGGLKDAPSVAKLNERLKTLMCDVESGVSQSHKSAGDFRTEEQGKVKKEEERIKKKWRDAGKEESREATEETQKASKDFVQSEAGHRNALDALERGKIRAKEALDAAEKEDWTALAHQFSLAAESVRSGMSAVYRYLSQVIDTQMSASNRQDLRRMSVDELAFAARAYFCYQAPTAIECRRMGSVVRCLMERVAPDGTIDALRPYHAADGVDFLPHDVEVLSALAELVRFSRHAISFDFAAKLFTDLMERRVKDPTSPKRLRGWRAHRNRPGASLEVDFSATAEAVDAMSAINSMLDDGINDIVLEHFSVKEEPGEVGLDQLFYPDFGLHYRLEAERKRRVDKGERVGRETVALTMLKMRAHISRGGKPGLHSLVLHGPAGTGKTTLVEALAKSCGVAMVEVTPSDIAKAGEAAIEQRARTVFAALALLTRVVILFDEFDPVLKRRDAGTASAFNIFSFLTPGMLPKLKELSDRAKDRSVAYVLITNLVGTLDEAAIRSGRFDEKVGVYPPDPLSRLGQLALRCGPEADRGPPGLNLERLLEVVQECHGKGMTALNKDGWFTRGTPRAPSPQEVTRPLDYVLRRGDLARIDWPEPEETLASVKGSGDAAELEFRQWGWVVDWDRKVASATDAAETRKQLLRWPTREAAKDSAQSLRNMAKSGDRHLLFGLLGDEIVLRWRPEPK